MKAIKRTLVVLFVINVICSYNQLRAQTTTFTVALAAPTRDEIRSGSGIEEIEGGTAFSETYLTSFGLNNYFSIGKLPQYMLDVYCDPTHNTLSDINVSCLNCSPANAVGYRIGGQMVLWYAGYNTNIYVGINAGNTTNVSGCVAVGYNALNNNTGTSNTGLGYEALGSNINGANNTAVGSAALSINIDGATNTATGFDAMHNNTHGYSNTANGAYALQSNTTGAENVAIGASALTLNTTWGGNTAIGVGSLGNNTQSYNTAAGYYWLYSNTTGQGNTGTGTWTLNLNQTGNNNTANGYGALRNSTVGNNTAIGYQALYYLTTGTDNTALGYNAGLSTTTTDADDLFLGSGADRYTGIVQNAAAIGYKAITSANNQFEIGNNNVTTTLGMSTYLPTKSPVVTRLELNTQYGSSPFNVAYNIASPVAPSPATGWSGLRFDDLTASSVPGVNPGGGVLALNSSGDVIYVSPFVLGGTGIGYCGTPCGNGSGLTIMTGNGGYALNNNNLYLNGNNAGPAVNNVAIGNGCCYTPMGKLDVLQSSGAGGSAGIYVRNTDPATSATPATIGIESYMPTNIVCNSPYNRTVAAWLEADGQGCYITSLGYLENYALFIPGGSSYGGGVAIGFPFASQPPVADGLLLNVNSAIQAASYYYPSDSTIKKNVAYFNSGIKIIRALKPVSFQYNGMGGYKTSDTHIGLIAQNLKRVAPYAVRSERIIKDTLKHDTGSILSIDNAAVMYIAINAIKQVDSLTVIQQKTIDSLRNALQSIQTCLNKLCGNNGKAGVTGPHNGDGDGTSSNNTNPALNTQDITLSASTGAPLLYQNVPNPFSVGTKINYYLPEGIMGATLVFFDTYGNMLKTVQLSQTGNGTLNITPDNLSNGIYSYSLVVNGAVIDTKKMLLQK